MRRCASGHGYLASYRAQAEAKLSGSLLRALYHMNLPIHLRAAAVRLGGDVGRAEEGGLNSRKEKSSAAVPPIRPSRGTSEVCPPVEGVTGEHLAPLVHARAAREVEAHGDRERVVVRRGPRRV